MTRIPAFLPLLFTLACGCSLTNFNKIPGVKRLTGPKPDPDRVAFRKKHCSDRSERPQPREGTPLYILHFEKNCGHNGVAACEVGLHAVLGKLPEAYADTFADLVHAKPGEFGAPQFSYKTCDITTRVPPYTLGLDGLGLTRSKAHQQVLVEFARDYGDKNFNDSSTQSRLARALFLSGESSPAEGALRSMLDVKPEADSYKPDVLKYLAAWESTSAVDYCMQTLRGGKGPKEACIWYLGETRHAAAYELVIRRMEDEEDAAVRALGHLGDARAVPILEKLLASSKNPRRKTTMLVALMNLGKAELFSEFERLLRGRTVLSSGAETSRPNIGIMEGATLEILELEDSALRDRALDYLDSLGDLDGQGAQAWRIPVLLAGVRASLGSAEAVQALGAMLDDPRKDVRHLVVRLAGSNFDQLRGLRVPDRALFAPLTRAYEMEPDRSAKRNIVLAAAYLGAT